MARSVRIETRVEPRIADLIDDARGVVPVSMWVEAAIYEKLGVEPRTGRRRRTEADADPEVAQEPVAVAPPEWPRRPPPRLTGGRRSR